MAQSLLSESVRNGLISTVVCGLVSAIAAFVLFLFLLNHVLGMVYSKVAIEPITYFYLSLLFWDVIAALGMMVNVRWVVLHRIETGHFCTSQAIVQQLSSTGTALSIVAMSFCILYNHVINLEKPLHFFAGPIGLVMIFIIQIIDIGVPNAHFGYLKYYGLAGYWCWIAEPYYWQKIFTEYFFFWLGAVFFIITATLFTFTRYGLRISFGFLWLGFMKGDRLFRLGLASFDSKNIGHPKFSLSIHSKTTLGVVDLIPIQYFDQYHMPTMVADDLGADTSGDVGRNEGAASTYPIWQQSMPHSSALNYPWSSDPPSSYGPNRDPEIDQMVERMYGPPKGPDYILQAPVGSTLVPNRLPTDAESVGSARSAESTSMESPLKLLLFPLVYFLIVAPLSIARFLEFAHKPISAGWVFFGASWFSLQGLLDVMLWIFARPAFGIDYKINPLIHSWTLK